MRETSERSHRPKPTLLRARDRGAYGRFQRAAEWPMLALAVAVAIALAAPYVVESHG